MGPAHGSAMKQILASGLALVVTACAVGGCATPGSETLSPGFVDGWVVPPLARVAGDGLEQDCPPQGWTRTQLAELKAAKFDIPDETDRQVFAMKLLPCLSNSDPVLRDGIAFEAYVHFLRERQLSDETMRGLLNQLATRLLIPDPRGFRESFSALALSEVARADRVEAFLTEDERAKLLVDAQHWFINISDYRGFDDVEGWRHAVAHGADLLMQLALNPEIDAEGLRLIVSAVGVQVAPEGHAYVHGESERLARPVLFAAARGAMSEAEWTDWLKAVATPKDAAKVFTSEAGLAWRHNTMAFLRALYVEVVVGGDAADDVLRPGLEAALRAMP
jgi:hypothetical protein